MLAVLAFGDGMATIEGIRLIKEQLPGVHTTLGLAFANVIPVDDMISRIERASGKAAAAE